MNTPAHLIFGLAAFGKPGHPRITAAALAGATIPDLSLYLLVGGSLAIDIPPQRIFDELYFSDAWQAVFRIDNSALIWGAFLADHGLDLCQPAQLLGRRPSRRVGRAD